jgi:hypothetical protein
MAAGRGVAHERTVTNLVVVLCFFPFFQLLPLGPSETQPISALVAILGLAAFGISASRPTFATLAFLAFTLGFGALSVVGHGVGAGAMLLQLAAYVAPLVVFLYLWDRLDQVSLPLVLACGFAYLILGTLQFLNLVPAIVNLMLGALITRYEAEVLTLGRGVVMFAAEPAYAAKILLMFLGFCLGFWRDGRISGSAIGVILLSTLLGLFLLFLCRPFIRILIAVAVAGSLTSGVVWLKQADISAVSQDAPRNVQVLAYLAQQAAKEEFNLGEVFRVGSARLITSTAGYDYASTLPVFGTGIGLADSAVRRQIDNDAFLRQVEFNRDAFRHLKPHAMVSAYVVETGVFGILAFAFLLVVIASRAMVTPRPALATSVACWGVAAWILFFTGVNSLPVPWVLFCIAGCRTVASADRNLYGFRS